MNKYLMVVAHPDDEALWFSSWIDESNVVIVTEPRKADTVYPTTNLRMADILKGHLNTSVMYAKLKTLISKLEEKPKAIITHSLYGDTFEHFHHQDVCLVAALLAIEFEIPLLCHGEKAVTLTCQRYLSDDEYSRKIDMLLSYWDDFAKIYYHYPISRDESLVQINPQDVKEYKEMKSPGSGFRPHFGYYLRGNYYFN